MSISEAQAQPIVFKVYAVQKGGFLGKPKKRLLQLTKADVKVVDFQKPSRIKYQIEWKSLVECKLVKGGQAKDSEKTEMQIVFLLKGKKKKFNFVTALPVSLLIELETRKSLARREDHGSFFVRQWQKTNEHNEFTLKVIGLNLFKFDNTTNMMKSSVKLKDIAKMYLLSDKPDVVMITYHNKFSVHYYSMTELEKFIASVNNRLSTVLRWPQIPVEKISSETVSQMRDLSNKLQGDGKFHSTYDVTKIKGKSSTRSRRLCISTDFIAEQDLQSENIHSLHEVKNIYCIVRYPGDDTKFSLEFRNNDTVLTYVTKKRDNAILDIREMCLRQDFVCPVLADIIQLGRREGIKTFPPVHEYSGGLMSRLAQGLKRQPSIHHYMGVVEEYNQSFQFKELIVADRRPMHEVLSALVSIEQLFSEGAIDLKTLRLYQQELMSAVQRLLYSKNSFEDVSSHKNIIQSQVIEKILMEQTTPGLKFFAVATLMEIVGHHSRNERAQQHNEELIMSATNRGHYMTFITKYGYDEAYTLSVDAFLQLFQNLLESRVSQTLSNALMLQLVQHDIIKVFYNLCRNSSVSIAIHATQLLVTLFMRLPNETFFRLQNEILLNGLLLFQLYQAIFCEDERLKAVSLQFVDLIVSFHLPSEKLMRLLIPHPLFKYLNGKAGRKEVRQQGQKKGMFGKTVAQKSMYEFQSNNWTEVLQHIQENFSSSTVIWNEFSRQDLKHCLEEETLALDWHNENYPDRQHAWNYQEFEVKYKSQKNEVKVGKYFLRFLTDEDEVNQTHFDDDDLLIKELYYRLLLEQKEDIQFQCARALKNVYNHTFARQGRPFPHLENLLSTIASEVFSQKVLKELILLIQAVTNVRVNKHAMKNDCIPILLGFVKKIHTEEHKQLAKICLEILINLAGFRTMGLKANQIIRPIPEAVRIMTHHEHFPYLIQTIVSSNDELMPRICKLLLLLLRINGSMAPSIYQTGIFYFIFSKLSGEEYTIFPEAVALFQALFRHQQFLKEDFGLTEDDHFMHALLPESLIVELESKSPLDFTKIFNGTTETLKLIWNKNMRKYLKEMSEMHLQDFYALLKEDQTALYTHEPLKKLAYKELEKQPFIGGYFIRNMNASNLSTIPNLSELFWKIVEGFRDERDENVLLHYVKIQLLILEKITLVNQKPYNAMMTCARILSVFDLKEANLTLVELTLRLVVKVTQEKVNLDACIGANMHEIFVSLLKKLFEFRNSENVSSHFAEKENKLCNYLTQGLFIMIKQLFPYPEMQEVIDTDSDFISLMLKSLLSLDVDSALKSVAQTLIALSRMKRFTESVWKHGLGLFLLKMMMYQRTDDIDDAEHHRLLVKADTSSRLLTEFLCSSCIIYEPSENFVVKDMNNLLPAPIVQHILAKGGQKDLQSVINIIKDQHQVPNMIWTVACQKQLFDYLTKQTTQLHEAQYKTTQVDIPKMVYPDIKKELMISGIFPRIYNMKQFQNWQLKNYQSYANGLLDFLGNLEEKPQPYIEMVLQSAAILLRRTHKTPKFQTLMREAFSTEENLPKLMALLTNPSLSTTSFNYLIDIIQVCLISDIFNGRLAAQSRIFHNFIYVFEYAQKKDKELTKNGLRILDEYCISNFKLCESMEQNGILLYLLYMFGGCVEGLSDQDRVSCCKLLRHMCHNKNLKTYVLLNQLLPRPIVDAIAGQDNIELVDAINFYEKSHQNPYIIWNDDMKSEFKMYLKMNVQDCMNSKQWIPDEKFKLQYQTIEKQLQVGQVYLRLFNQDPNYSIPHGSEFLSKLVEALMFTKDRVVQLEILDALNNLLQQQQGLKQYRTLDKSIPVLFGLVGDINVHPAIVLVVLQLLYKILSVDNPQFVSKTAENPDLIEKVIFRFNVMPDHAELFLLLLLSFVRQSDAFSKSYVSSGCIKRIAGLLKGERNKKSDRAAQLLRYMVSKSQYSDSTTTIIDETCPEEWQTYQAIQVPPQGMSLPDSLKTQSQSEPQRRLNKQYVVPDVREMKPEQTKLNPIDRKDAGDDPFHETDLYNKVEQSQTDELEQSRHLHSQPPQPELTHDTVSSVITGLDDVTTDDISLTQETMTVAQVAQQGDLPPPTQSGLSQSTQKRMVEGREELLDSIRKQ